jgi:hypothetical protein
MRVNYGCGKISQFTLKTPHGSMQSMDGAAYFTTVLSYTRKKFIEFALYAPNSL